jgi:hypothetical protein
LSSQGKFPIIEEHSIPKSYIEKKRDNEKIAFLALTHIYCKGNNHLNREEYIGSGKLPLELQEKADRFSGNYPNWKRIALCPHCYEMVKMAEKHVSGCPHMAYKTFCHSCPKPCYPKAHLEKIRPMMRYSGPRLMLRHPVIAFKYFHGVMKAKYNKPTP